MKSIVFLFSLIVILGGIQFAYAHGLGSVESDIQFFNNNFYKVKVQTNPDVLQGNESEIGFKILTINHDENNMISNVEYLIDIVDPETGDLILSFSGYSPDESFNAKIIPKNEINISGDQTSNAFWIGTNQNPLVIEAPLFMQGGLVQVNVNILSIDSESLPRPPLFETLLTIGEYIPFEVTIDKKYDLTATFNYLERNEQIQSKQYRALEFIKNNSSFTRGKGFFRTTNFFYEAFKDALEKYNFIVDEKQSNSTYLTFRSKNIVHCLTEPQLSKTISMGFRFFDKTSTFVRVSTRSNTFSNFFFQAEDGIRDF